MPTRESLGVAARGSTYYPAYLEYGWKDKKTGKHVAAKAPIRKSVNEAARFERSMIESQLKKEIEKEWKNIAKRVSKGQKII